MNDKVLLVSDCHETAEKIRNELRGSPFSVEITDKAVFALELLKNNDYHIIIGDVDSKDGCAFELLHKIKVLQYPAGVVLLAESVKADDILLAYDLGAIDIIDKGFESGVLAAVVNKSYESIDQGE